MIPVTNSELGAEFQIPNIFYELSTDFSDPMNALLMIFDAFCPEHVAVHLGQVNVVGRSTTITLAKHSEGHLDTKPCRSSLQ